VATNKGSFLAENPGAYGIDHATKMLQSHIDDGFKRWEHHLTTLLATKHRETQSLLGTMYREAHAAHRRMEGKVKKMADQFDQLRQLIASGQQAAKDEAVQVNGKLTELTTLIQQLQDTINQGVPVPQDVADSMTELIGEIQTILPDGTPAPPAGRRR
jgi:phosphoglycerate-specific signal transduction histidine kinase